MDLAEIIKSIEKESTKENHELIWAHIFIYHINNEKKFDYVVEPGPNDLTDVYAKSVSGKFPLLKLQLTWAVEKDFNPKKEIKSLEFSSKIVLKTVKHKFDKYKKQGKIHYLSEIILVIQGDITRGWLDLLDDKNVNKEIKKYPFAGIYYVSPPVIRSSQLDRTQIKDDGFIVCFKDAFALK